MKFGIIAAGEGSRLAQEGIALPKPLIALNGEPMIDRLVRIFNENGADEIAIIVNRLHPQTEEHVRQLIASGRAGNVRLVAKTTPSSMHSFFELAPFLDGAPFCLTTVDTIFREDEFADYIRAFKADTEADGMMGVTDFIDDEKPLYIATDEQMRITAFLDEFRPDVRFISGGIYALRPQALATLRRCMAEGRSRMRNFQRGLIEDGLRLTACKFSKILDVDHASDIAKAEAFLNENNSSPA